MALSELKNSIDSTSLSVDNLKAIWKKHIQEYWIIPDEEGLIDLKLDIVGDETLRADNDVTDHYVESNKAYQDQITHKPKVYTINGEVGELVWYQRDKSAQVLGQVAQKLEGVISFLPVRSSGFNQMKKNIMKASQWVDTTSNALTKLSTLVGKVKAVTGLGTLGTKESLTHQEQSYILLLWIRDNNKPINIRTPWGVLNGYVITNLELRQPKETKDKTYISITFKEFRTTSIQSVEFDEKKYQGNAALENQPKADQGKTPGEDVSLPKEDMPIEENEENLTSTKTPKMAESCSAVGKDGTKYTYYRDTDGSLMMNAQDPIGAGNGYYKWSAPVEVPRESSYWTDGENVGWLRCEKTFTDWGITREK